jgi:hypothetical protein
LAPGWSTGYAGSVLSHAPATLPGSVAVAVAAAVGGVGAGAALVEALGVGLVGVSGSAVTVGMGPVGAAGAVGSVEPGSTVPTAVTVGDSTADVVRGAVTPHAESASPRTTAVAAEANRALPLLPS